jgi:hypothetical protein
MNVCTHPLCKWRTAQGTPSGSGNSDAGIVFELSPGASGWTETILFQFDLDGDESTGNTPQGGDFRR